MKKLSSRKRIPPKFGGLPISEDDIKKHAPVGTLTCEQLVLTVPVALRGKPETIAFVEESVNVANYFADVGKSLYPPSRVAAKIALQDTEIAAKKMQSAMAPFIGETEGLDLVDWCCGSQFSVKLKAGSSRVNWSNCPPLNTTAPNLTKLLTRLWVDLETLRVTCGHTAGKIESKQYPPVKKFERLMIQDIAQAHFNAFGELPPKRSWFGNHFMPLVGDTMGLEIGHKIVGEVISAMPAMGFVPQSSK
jgi:hypothetical protein